MKIRENRSRATRIANEARTTLTESGRIRLLATKNTSRNATKYTNYMKIMAKRIRELLNMAKEQYDIRVCVILALIVKIRRKLDYRGLSGHFKENSDEAGRCELQKLYGKSRLQQIVSE